MMRRGDIHYIESRIGSDGAEQRNGRPAIIVSNSDNVYASTIVQVVFLTTSPKWDTDTHVTINSTLKPSTALCEQITSVDTDRIGTYFATCTEAEMEAVDEALCKSLALTRPEAPMLRRAVPAPNVERSDTAAIEKERDMYKLMYENLLDKILGGSYGRP